MVKRFLLEREGGREDRVLPVDLPLWIVPWEIGSAGSAIGLRGDTFHRHKIPSMLVKYTIENETYAGVALFEYYSPYHGYWWHVLYDPAVGSPRNPNPDGDMRFYPFTGVTFFEVVEPMQVPLPAAFRDTSHRKKVIMRMLKELYEADADEVYNYIIKLPSVVNIGWNPPARAADIDDMNVLYDIVSDAIDYLTDDELRSVSVMVSSRYDDMIAEQNEDDEV